MFLNYIIAQVFTGVQPVEPVGPEIDQELALDGILSLVFMVIALISLIVIVIQGIKYSLSSGNPEQTSSALRGIIYALVGLVVATSAWNIINFALDKVITDDIDATGTGSDSTVINLLSNIADVIVIIGSIIAIIMIIVGGIRFITSGGSSEQAGKAKNTIIYALVGLAVSITAGPIVGTVLDRLA